MSAAIAIYENDPRLGKPETFYVPSFKVKIDGAGLPQNLLRDVLSVTYGDKVGELDTFDLRVANWDAEKHQPKFEPPSQSSYQGIFDPGGELELRMGYAGRERLMLRGQITSLEPDFPESGPPTLSVRGLDVLHKYRKTKHTKSWTNEKASAIAKQFAASPSADRPGLGVTIDVDPPADEPELPYVLMDNQYDIVFLLDLAHRSGYVLFVVEPGGADEHLYFGPEDKAPEAAGGGPAAAPAYKLERGKSLVSFQPRLTTVKQVSAIEVRGWNRRTKKPIVKKATLSDLPADQQKKLSALSKAVGDRVEIVADQPVYTPEQAKALAVELLRNQAARFIEASGTTVGLPDLRSGARVQIVGYGKRFDGAYVITSTRHTIGAGGYRTEFSAAWRGES
jgi:Bacteriophage probable baseplate hub protein